MATHQDTGYELPSVEEGQQIITPYEKSGLLVDLCRGWHATLFIGDDLSVI